MESNTQTAEQISEAEVNEGLRCLINDMDFRLMLLQKENELLRRVAGAAYARNIAIEILGRDTSKPACRQRLEKAEAALSAALEALEPASEATVAPTVATEI